VVHLAEKIYDVIWTAVLCHHLPADQGEVVEGAVVAVEVSAVTSRFTFNRTL